MEAVMAEEKEKKEEPWWLAVVGGLLLLGGAYWVYRDLTAFEAEGGTRKVQWVLALLYNYLGKWGVVGFMVLGGLGATLHGALQLRKKLSGGEEEAPTRRRKDKRPRRAPSEE